MFACQKCLCDPCVCYHPISSIPDGGTWKFVGDSVDYEKIREIVREEVSRTFLTNEYQMMEEKANETILKAMKYDALIRKLSEAGLELEDEDN